MNLSESKYGKYVNERLSADILENEFGFIVYQVKGKEAFILEGFIEEDHRNNGKGSFLCAELCNIVKELGANVVTANIFLFDKGASNSLLAGLKMGFKVNGANNGCISIFKEIGG